MASSEALTIMTFNLRFANETDAHPWSARRSAMIQQMCRAAPTVLGTQEGLKPQLDDILAGLPERYAWVGTSREGSDDGEYCAVFYDQRRLAVLGVDQRWLSETPDRPGSITWGRHPRILTAVSFRRLGGGQLLVVNTHLDHWSLAARRFGVDCLRRYVREHAHGRPVVVLGDFNTGARISQAYRHLLETPLLDAFDVATDAGPDHPTFANYQPPRRSGPRIDWVLVSPGVTVDSCRIDADPIDGAYASDHLPVIATIHLPGGL